MSNYLALQRESKNLKNENAKLKRDLINVSTIVR